MATKPGLLIHAGFMSFSVIHLLLGQKRKQRTV